MSAHSLEDDMIYWTTSPLLTNGPTSQPRFGGPLARAAALTAAIALAGPAAPVRALATADLAAQVCTVDKGQQFIDDGEYEKAVKTFSCVIEADPTGVDGYRGRIEAELLLGRFSDAVMD